LAKVLHLGKRRQKIAWLSVVTEVGNVWGKHTEGLLNLMEGRKIAGATMKFQRCLRGGMIGERGAAGPHEVNL
jgi:hypothetical protein